MDDFFDGDNIFIYRGGRAPQHVTHARIDKSVSEIEEEAFDGCENLLQVETHNGLRRVGKWAFRYCISLRQINLKSVIDIDDQAFFQCTNLADVEVGDRLATIGDCAFVCCYSLTHLKLPSVITIERLAFLTCADLADVELSERLETIGAGAFANCKRLLRIAIPLKRDLFALHQLSQRYNQFDKCDLRAVDLVGGIQKTVTSLHMESWRDEMIEEINRINQVLPNTPKRGKTEVIRQWMNSVVDKIDYYKAEHHRYVKEGITLLELALWKAKLGEKDYNSVEGGRKKAKVDGESARKERRITCGADIVIKNVLPFLKLE